MLRQLTILSIFVPFWGVGQTEIYPLPTSPHIIWDRCIALNKAGKLDSVWTPITFFKDYYHRIDSIKQFYIHVDTVHYSDSSFAVGQIILDPFIKKAPVIRTGLHQGHHLQTALISLLPNQRFRNIDLSMHDIHRNLRPF